VYEVGLILSLMAIPSTLVSMAATVTQALGRARLFLPLSIASVAIQATLTIPLSSISPVAVAGGHAATLGLTAVILYRMVFGPGWSSIVLEALQRSAPAFALAAVFVLVRLPFGWHPGAGLAVVAGAVGLVTYVALAILLWPAVAGAFVDLVRRAPSYLRSAPRAAGR
jgi:O-antigen/teichoic acid export membrane protein